MKNPTSRIFLSNIQNLSFLYLSSNKKVGGRYGLYESKGTLSKLNYTYIPNLVTIDDGNNLIKCD